MDTFAVVRTDRPEVVAYMNLFEWGDYWVKVEGCEECPSWSREKCCSGCKMFYGGGCAVHEGRSPQLKPFECVVNPVPNQGRPGCTLVYKCLKGKHVGKLRHVNKGLDELLDG